MDMEAENPGAAGTGPERQPADAGGHQHTMVCPIEIYCTADSRIIRAAPKNSLSVRLTHKQTS